MKMLTSRSSAKPIQKRTERMGFCTGGRGGPVGGGRLSGGRGGLAIDRLMMAPKLERRRLGRTEIEVPAIGMGTWRTFDTSEDRRPLVEAALASGIDLFDSSPMYGRAEETLGRALEGIRERVLVATKIWTADAEEGRAQAEGALRLYGSVDIYQVHNLLNVP